ncbi:sensor histidine kinase [Pseudarthrobacter sp. NPDC058329]|uniref:sensor histidine kinase n=1 Tax=Pseudarthrobacter sp. NPDC058329 TaxID=3346448 RepID=UPI0036DCA9EC
MKGFSPALDGVSALATHRLMGRGVAAFAALLLLHATGSIMGQTPHVANWWNFPFLWLFLALVAAFAGASVRGRGLVWIARALALLVLAGLALWTLAVPATIPEGFGTPWMWAMINVGAAWCAYGAGTRIGCTYTVAVGAVFFAVRTTPQGGSASSLVALEDALFATVLGLIICVTIGILRRAAERADTAAENAIDRYREAAAQTALGNERLRLDGLLHDSVMTALLTAAHAGSAEERAASANLAASALDRLEQQGTTSEAAPATLTEIAARIRFTVAGATEGPVIHVVCDAAENLLLPGAAVRAIFEAATEAVRNAVRHSEAARCEVRLTGHRTGNQAKVSVSIKDNGRGFDPALVSDRRLGIKVCIVGRMQAADGSAAIHSSHRSGAEVRLDWEGVAA